MESTDVEAGSVVSLGFGINGERDIVTYNQHIAPKVFIPNHVTAVAVESSLLEWKVGLKSCLLKNASKGIQGVSVRAIAFLCDWQTR